MLRGILFYADAQHGSVEPWRRAQMMLLEKSNITESSVCADVDRFQMLIYGTAEKIKKFSIPKVHEIIVFHQNLCNR